MAPDYSKSSIMKSDFDDGNDYPGGAERALLPKHIGGYQHLEPDVVTTPDDILVQDGVPVSFCTGYAGKVGDVESASGCNVYRKMPVAKQSDSHERDVAAIKAQVTEIHGSRIANALPTDAQARKRTPIYSGFLKYFPRACAEVARVSLMGNEQHNPGQPLHWDRSKSGDELDAATRHLMEAGTFDKDGVRHSAKFAWRSMANLEKELEAAEREHS